MSLNTKDGISWVAVNQFLYHFERGNDPQARQWLDSVMPVTLKEKIREIVSNKLQDHPTKVAALDRMLEEISPQKKAPEATVFEGSHQEPTAKKDPAPYANRALIDKIFKARPLVTLILSNLNRGQEIAKTAGTSPMFNLVAADSDRLVYLQLESKACLNFKELKQLSEMHGMSYSEIIGYCTNLRTLDLSNSDIDDQQLSAIFKKVSPTLQVLSLNSCESIQKPPDLSCLPNLRMVDLCGCTNLQNPPNVSNCQNLLKLKLDYCTNLQNPPDLSECLKLEELSLRGCSLLQNPPNVSNCSHLAELDLSRCTNLRVPPNLSDCKRVQIVRFTGCSNLQNLPDFRNCEWLNLLELTGCKKLKGAACLDQLKLIIRLFLP